jgi:hypothetical protein
MAVLLDSVAQEVKTISAGSQFTNPATLALAASMADFTLRPAQWVLEGLPNRVRK